MGWLFGYYTRKELVDHLCEGNGVTTRTRVAGACRRTASRRLRVPTVLTEKTSCGSVQPKGTKAMPPTPQVAHLVAYGQTLASVQSLPGVRVQAEASADGI